MDPPKKPVKIDFKAVLRPAECTSEVDPAECAEPGEDYRRGSGRIWKESGC